MEITLQTVREVLRSAFGPNSFIAAFINNVKADENCTTASIDGHGVMRYSPTFVQQYVTSPGTLFCLVTHELMHPMFGHFVYKGGQLENIGADIVINASISLLFSQRSGDGALFRKLYTPEGIEGLLRPGSDMEHSRYRRLYDAFYNNHVAAPRPARISTGEVIQALKVLTPGQDIHGLLVLGRHGGADDGEASGIDGRAPVLSGEALSGIAQDLKCALGRSGRRMAGFGTALYNCLVDVLRTHVGLKRALLDRFTTRQKVDRFRRILTRPRIGVSPIPIRPSKRDFVLLAADVPPSHYHNVAYRQTTQERGLAVYLDVSGSVNQYMPEIIGLLRSLRTELKTIFLFSNKVAEAPFRTLLAGHIETTYGTDFDCIAEHVLENRFDRAVILTDGYASMSQENQEQLIARKLRALTVLFGGRTESPDFEVLGEVVQLDEITD